MLNFNKIAISFIFILKNTLKKFEKYLLTSIDKVEKYKSNGYKYRSIKKIENEIIKISAKSKSRNLPKSRFENLFIPKKVQNTSIKKESNFLILHVRITFIKLYQVFNQIIVLQHFNLESHIEIEINLLGYNLKNIIS